MTRKQHGITLAENLFEDLLRSHDRRIIIQDAGHMQVGDLIRITEVTKNRDIATGKSEDFIITDRVPKMSSAFRGLVILKLQKYFPYQ